MLPQTAGAHSLGRYQHAEKNENKDRCNLKKSLNWETTEI